MELCIAISYEPVPVTRCALVGHRHLYFPPRCRTSKYRRTFIALSAFLWEDLADLVFDCVRLTGFKSRSNAFSLAKLLVHIRLLLLPFIFFRSMDWYCRAGVFRLIGCKSPNYIFPTFPNNNDKQVLQ